MVLHLGDEHDLQQILADYLEADDAGQAPERTEFLTRHPNFSEELTVYFKNQDRVDQLAAPLRLGARESAPPSSREAPAPRTLPFAFEGEPPRCPAERAAARSFGDFELLEEIARGGMGVVYRARQVSLNRTVALKTILTGQFASAMEIQRFRREAEAAACLDHPHIVPIYEVGEHEGQHYFSMKLIDGGSLADLLRTSLTTENAENAEERQKDHEKRPRPSCSPRSSSATSAISAVKLLIPVARAVHYAHQRGILHRDLKPANILLQTADGGSRIGGELAAVPLVTDFGLAKQVRQDRGLTESGWIVGTPSYMAPEQAAARKDLSTATDVYSLGAILYELITGQPPFRADNALDTLLQVMEREPERPRTLNPSADRDLETICLRCLEKEPEKRYNSAEALAEDLEHWLRQEPIQARRSSIGERLVKWVRRKPAQAALVAVSALALLLLAGSGVGFTVHLNEARKQAENERDDKDEARKLAEKERDDKDEALKLAQRERDAKDKALRRAEAYRLTFNAEVVRPTNPAQSLVLAIEGSKRHRDLLLNNALLASLDACLEERTFLAHQGAVLDAVLSPDGTQLVTCSEDRTARIWNVATGKEIRRLTHDMPAAEAAMARKRGIAPAEDTVIFAVYSADGRRLLTVSSRRNLYGPRGEQYGFGRHVLRTVRTWDPASGKLLATWTEPGTAEEVYRRYRDESYAAAFSPDGKRIVVAFSVYPGCPPRVLDTDTGKEVFVLDGHHGPAGTAAFSPDGKRIVTGSLDGTVCIWDAVTGKRLHQLRGDSQGVILALFAPDSQRIVTIGEGRTHSIELQANGRVLHKGNYNVHRLLQGGAVCGRIWDVQTGNEVVALAWPTQVYHLIRTAAFSPDGRLIATGCDNRTRTGGFEIGAGSPACIWDSASGKLLVQDLGSNSLRSQIRDIAFSANGRWLLAAGAENTVRLCDVRTGKERAVFQGHEGTVYSAAFSRDGRHVVTASADASARLWDARVDQETLPSKGVWSNMKVMLSPDTNHVRGMYSRGHPYRLFTNIWDTHMGKERASFNVLQKGTVRFSDFSPDGTKVITCLWGDKAARLWNVADGKLLMTLEGHRANVEFALFSPDGKRVVTFSGDNEVQTFLWDAGTGKRLSSLTEAVAGGANIRFRRLKVAFSPDNRHLALASEENGPGPMRWRLWVFELPSMKECWSFIQGKNGSSKGSWNTLVYNATGDRLLTTNGAEACIRNAATGTEEVVIPRTDENELLWFAAFSPNGQSIVTMGTGKLVHLWDARSGKKLKELKGHQGQGVSAAFSPNGSLLATVAEDATVRIWDLRSYTEILTLKHGSQVSWARFTQDGRHVFTATENGGRLWPIDPLKAALSRQPRDVTASERERFEIAER